MKIDMKEVREGSLLERQRMLGEINTLLAEAIDRNQEIMTLQDRVRALRDELKDVYRENDVLRDLAKARAALDA